MNVIRYFAGLAVVALLVAAPSLAQAQYWLPTTGNWSVGADWSTGSVPGTSAGATINNGGTVTIDNSTGTANCSTIFVGNGTANGGPGITGAVNMTGGVLNATSQEQIGHGSVSQSGFFSQSGGVNGTTATFLYLGYMNGGVGSYQLSGNGQLTEAVEYLGYAGAGTVATGTFLQTGGTNGDAVKPVAIYVGGMGLNGAATNGKESQGSYTLNGGLIRGGQVSVGGQYIGTFTQNGGTLATLGGGGVEGSANYNNQDGDLMLGVWNGSGNLGHGNGTYTMNGGLIDTTNVPSGNGGNEYIGLKGTGTFIQTGGTNHIAQSLYLVGMGGEFADPNLAGVGSYTLSNTGLLTVVNGSENIGNMDQSMGTATFTQSGGTNTCSSIAVAAGVGTYNLNGGLVNGVTSFSGPLNFTGGTIQAGGPLSIQGSIALGSAGTGILDVNGQPATLGGVTGVNAGGALKVVDSHGGGALLINGSVDGTIGGPNFTMTGIATTIAPANSVYVSGTISVGGLITASNLTTLAFQFLNNTTGVTGDLLTIGSGGLTVNPNTAMTFSYIDYTGTQPTLPLGSYDLINGNYAGAVLSNFDLPAAPAGETYKLVDTGTAIDLVVATVPEPGTFALLGAGLMSLLGFAWRRRKAD